MRWWLAKKRLSRMGAVLIALIQLIVSPGLAPYAAAANSIKPIKNVKTTLGFSGRSFLQVSNGILAEPLLAPLLTDPSKSRLPAGPQATAVAQAHSVIATRLADPVERERFALVRNELRHDADISHEIQRTDSSAGQAAAKTAAATRHEVLDEASQEVHDPQAWQDMAQLVEKLLGPYEGEPLTRDRIREMSSHQKHELIRWVMDRDSSGADAGGDPVASPGGWARAPSRLGKPTPEGSPSGEQAPPAPTESQIVRQHFSNPWRAARVGLVASFLALSSFLGVSIVAAILGAAPNPNFESYLPAVGLEHAAIINIGLLLLKGPIHGFIEEVFARHGGLGSLSKIAGKFSNSRLWTRWIPAIIFSAAFTLLHESQDPFAITFRFASGLILSSAYLRAGILASAVAHTLNNILIPMLLLTHALLGPFGSLGLFTAYLIAVAVSAWTLLRDRRNPAAAPETVLPHNTRYFGTIWLLTPLVILLMPPLQVLNPWANSMFIIMGALILLGGILPSRGSGQVESPVSLADLGLVRTSAGIARFSDEIPGEGDIVFLPDGLRGIVAGESGSKRLVDIYSEKAVERRIVEAAELRSPQWEPAPSAIKYAGSDELSRMHDDYMPGGLQHRYEPVHRYALSHREFKRISQEVRALQKQLEFEKMRNERKIDPEDQRRSDQIDQKNQLLGQYDVRLSNPYEAQIRMIRQRQRQLEEDIRRKVGRLENAPITSDLYLGFDAGGDAIHPAVNDSVLAEQGADLHPTQRRSDWLPAFFRKPKKPRIRGLYAMDDRGNIRFQPRDNVGDRHSVPAGGEEVAGAGNMTFERQDNGRWRLVAIDNDSGHYLPSAHMMLNVLGELRNRGVDIGSAQITLVTPLRFTPSSREEKRSLRYFKWILKSKFGLEVVSSEASRNRAMRGGIRNVLAIRPLEGEQG